MIKKSILIRRSLIALDLMLSSHQAYSRALEPQKIELNRDTKFIESLNLSRNDWNDPIVNILIVGQDARGGVFKDKNYVAENQTQAKGLASRADGNLVLSFNKLNGQISLFSLYRGMMVPDEYWAGVADTPREKTEKYLSNYYTFAGRAKYIEFVRQNIEKMIFKTGTVKNSIGVLNYPDIYTAANSQSSERRFKIHGLVETEFSGFKAAFAQFLNYRDAFTAMTLASGQMRQMITIASNKQDIFRSLSINAMSEQERTQEALQSQEGAQVSKAKDSSTVLSGLRERKSFNAGGYQRSFNHAKFIATLLGYFAYAMAESDRQLLSAGTIVNGFSILSSTFTLNDFERYLMLKNGNHILTKAGFVNGYSPVLIHQMGYSFQSHLSFFADRKALNPAQGYDSILGRVDENLNILPKASNCTACTIP